MSNLLPETAVSPLRQRLIDDMSLRRFSQEPAPSPDRLTPCRCCGGRMTVVEIFGRFMQSRGPPTASTPTGMRAA